MKLATRLYQCEKCKRYSYHSTNHTGDIYPWCGKVCDETTTHHYIEDVAVVTIDEKTTPHTLGPTLFWPVIHTLGRIMPVDYGRRVYVTKTLGGQAESLAQMKARLSA